MITTLMKTDTWYVLYTKSRNEKKVAEYLDAAGYEVYCPTITTIRQWSDRKKKVEEPLFKSYVFVKTEESRRQQVVQAPGVVCFLYWLQKPAIVRTEEIAAIRRFTEEAESAGATDVAFESGGVVRIDWGRFQGQEGKYLAKQGNYLVLLIECLGRVVKARVPAAHVVSV